MLWYAQQSQSISDYFAPELVTDGPVLVIEGVVHLHHQSSIVIRESAIGLSEVGKGVIGIGLGPDIPEEYGENGVLFQLGVIGFLVPHASEVDVGVVGLDEVVGVCEAEPLHLLSDFHKQLVVYGLQEAVMHLPQQVLAAVLELQLAEALPRAGFQTLHEEDLHLHQRQVRSHYFSELELVQPCKVNLVSHVVGSLDDIQKLGRDAVLLLQPFHSSINVRIVKSLNFPEQRLDGHSLTPRPLYEDGVSECEHALVESKFLNGYVFAGIAFLEYVDGFAVALVYVLPHVLQTEGAAHAQQVGGVDVQQHTPIPDILRLEKGLHCFTGHPLMGHVDLTPKTAPSGVPFDGELLLGGGEEGLVGILRC